VRATRDALVALVERAAVDAAAWRAAASDADRDGARLAGSDVALTWAATKRSRLIDFRGYAYKREPSAISGGVRIRYDATRPQIWRVPLFDELKPQLVVRAPGAGYLVPAAWAARVVERLRLHGLSFVVVERAHGPLPVETFRAASVSFAKAPFEGHTMAMVTGAWAKESREVAAGSLFVPIAQPRARLVMQLLEPRAPDSLVSWGLFNAVFERKEYMEPYVAEAVGEELLARDPRLRAELLARLASDAAFAADPERRLEWCYRHHPSWNERLDLYPIYRLERAPERAP
jgi:hypothetical protein